MEKLAQVPFEYMLHIDLIPLSVGCHISAHLKHAVADAGPDISVTLPVSSVIISAKDTKGAVKTYKWWSPISVTKGGGLTTSVKFFVSVEKFLLLIFTL